MKTAWTDELQRKGAQHEKAIHKENAEEFLKAPLWNGKVFMQVQEDVVWSDW